MAIGKGVVKTNQPEYAESFDGPISVDRRKDCRGRHRHVRGGYRLQGARVPASRRQLQ